MAIEKARTAAVNLFVLVQVAYLLNCRSLDRSPLRTGLLTNPWVPVGIGTMIGLQLLFTYTPFMNKLFHAAPIDGSAWLRIIAIAAAVYVVVEIEKWLRRTLHGRARPGR
ncbi:cation transporting ATPase C-terminal domain-containing protein [Pseudonocardia sp. H11422]|uniref:cation transporting ATPase C-terminal domain-containing protein n=1 Tax=Pseudonocardia sp. H11422 TaxID=2835866 RepID=UPI001BDBB692